MSQDIRQISHQACEFKGLAFRRMTLRDWCVLADIMAQRTDHDGYLSLQDIYAWSNTPQGLIESLKLVALNEMTDNTFDELGDWVDWSKIWDRCCHLPFVATATPSNTGK